MKPIEQYIALQRAIQFAEADKGEESSEEIHEVMDALWYEMTPEERWLTGEAYEELKAELASCTASGCNHGNCEQAAEDEAKREAAEEREHDRLEDAWRDE